MGGAGFWQIKLTRTVESVDFVILPFACLRRVLDLFSAAVAVSGRLGDDSRSLFDLALSYVESGKLVSYLWRYAFSSLPSVTVYVFKRFRLLRPILPLGIALHG